MPVQPGSRRTYNSIELAVIGLTLVALAITVVPRFSNAVSLEAETNLRESLHQLRTQIMVYRAEHNGMAPGYQPGAEKPLADEQTLILQLTSFTDVHGRWSASPSHDFRFGPYLRQAPVNPLMGNNQVRIIGADVAFPTVAEGPEGWVYQPSTATIAPNTPGADINGVPYIDY